MGIRKKISIGFLCLGLVLAFSGMASYFELSRLSKLTASLLESNSRSIDLAKRMLDAVQHQNTLLLEIIALEDDTAEADLIAGREAFNLILEEAAATVDDRILLDGIIRAGESYNRVTDMYFDPARDTDIRWFVEMYRTSYNDITSAIKDYMVISQTSVSDNISDLKSNAYRATMPGVITLSVALLMVLMFAFLLDTYYTKPLLGINRAAGEFLDSRKPFTLKTEGRDEIAQLSDHIAAITTLARSKKPDRE